MKLRQHCKFTSPAECISAKLHTGFSYYWHSFERSGVGGRANRPTLFQLWCKQIPTVVHQSANDGRPRSGLSLYHRATVILQRTTAILQRTTAISVMSNCRSRDCIPCYPYMLCLNMVIYAVGSCPHPFIMITVATVGIAALAFEIQEKNRSKVPPTLSFAFVQ